MAATWWLVLEPATRGRRAIPIHHGLVVGRECAGVLPYQRLVLDEPSVSRNHFAIHVDAHGQLTLIDSSTNGTPCERSGGGSRGADLA